MNNTFFTNKLIASHNQIHHFISKHEHEFLACLNGKTLGKNKTPFTRREYAGAHYFYSYRDDKHFQWINELYYFTYNVLTWYGVRSFSIRKDYIDYISLSDKLDILYFIVLDYEQQKMWKVPASEIKKRIHEKTAFYSDSSIYEDVIINLTNDDYHEDMCFDEAVQNYEHSFDPKYWQPQYIENFTYALHRNVTNTKLIIVKKTDPNNTYVNKTFKSISEAYEFSVKKGYDKSYKTFQRAAAKSTIIEGKETYVFITTDMKAENPFNNPDLFIGKELWKETVVNEVENNATKEEVEEFAQIHEPETNVDEDDMDEFIARALPGLVEYYSSIDKEEQAIIDKIEQDSIKAYERYRIRTKDNSEIGTIKDYVSSINTELKTLELMKECLKNS